MLDASGRDGSGVDYIQRVARELKEAGIDDPVVTELEATIVRLSQAR